MVITHETHVVVRGHVDNVFYKKYGMNPLSLHEPTSTPYDFVYVVLIDYLSAWPEERGTTDTDGGAYSPFRSIFLVLTHDFIIIQVYGPTGGDG